MISVFFIKFELKYILMKDLYYRLSVVLCFLFVLTGASAQMTWYNPIACDTPYVNGRAWNVEIGKNYSRFPERFKGKVTDNVWNISRNSSGLSIHFITNSKTIQIKYTLAEPTSDLRNMAALNQSGIDMYAMDVQGRNHRIGNHMKYHFGANPGDTITVTFDKIESSEFHDRGLEYELFLTPYNTVTSLCVGVEPKSDFKFLHQSSERPIVVYGTSIVQGASPSRPGLMWTNIVERELDYPLVNLGFSGSAFMEPSLFETMGEINARAYVIDAMPNSFKLGKEEIIQRAVSGVKYLRTKSNAPILLTESCGSPDSVYCPSINREYCEGDANLRQAYKQLQSDGVKNIFYLTRQEIGLTEDAMIEGTHPNDIGNMLYAKAYEKKLREMLSEDTPNANFPPIRQRRDGIYEWLPRHNEVIRLNHTTDPEILMIGNSITHFWGGKPYSCCYGGNSWNKFFGKRRVTNMGFGWDRIENVYWRIFHGELEGCQLKHICLLIGVNNIGIDSEEKIADGVVALAGLIRARQPQAKLHVIKIYPAKGREEIIRRINSMIQQKLVLDDYTDLVDITDNLVIKDGSGKINPDFFLQDGTHPNEKGYTQIAKVLKKELK